MKIEKVTPKPKEGKNTPPSEELQQVIEKTKEKFAEAMTKLANANDDGK